METPSMRDLPLPDHGRRRVLRDTAVFQVKLFTDGLKDLFLSPLSVLAALIGVLLGGSNPGALLYRLLRAGQRFEDWIGLFAAAYPRKESESGRSSETQTRDDSSEPPGTPPVDVSSGDFDALVDRLQASLLDRDARTRLSERSRQQLESIANRLRRDHN